MAVTQTEVHNCYHCGNTCDDDHIALAEKYFCCDGCKLVYEILQENDLCKYYQLEDHPGVQLKQPKLGERFAYLDDALVEQKLLDYRDEHKGKVTFYLPAIHCSSCIWLLENLYRLSEGVQQSRIDFLKKQLSITYDRKSTTLRQLVELLTSIGYEPHISLHDLDAKPAQNQQRKLLYKIGVAGFCFGNIMLLSFPEYFGFDSSSGSTFSRLFNWLNLALALPVFLYSGSGYFVAAWQGLKQKWINIDVPLALGIAALFFRSLYEVVAQVGPGYFDSLAGLVFLLLIGKWIQQRTFDTLSFDRDYQSYFPVAVTTIDTKGEETTVSVTQLKTGDRIKVRNQELIPADSMLLRGEAQVDFSFVTGESDPQTKTLGEVIYAGGRQMGQTLELEVVKPVSQSYLTQLWNDHAFSKAHHGKLTNLSNRIGKYFTIGLLLIAAGAALYWLPQTPEQALNAFTAVLIVACPCALALSVPFALGNGMRILGRSKMYVKQAEVIEAMAKVDTLVFDKTGTITTTGAKQVIYAGELLHASEHAMIASVVKQSTHPLSRAIYKALKTSEAIEVSDFYEKAGAGIRGIVNGQEVLVGSAKWVNYEAQIEAQGSQVYISIAGCYKGCFSIQGSYREGLLQLAQELETDYELFLLSGDLPYEQQQLLPVFEDQDHMFFQCSPEQKLQFIRKRQQEAGDKVMMIGDGLNDAGALKQSDIGLAVSEDVSNFSPACDVIFDADSLVRLPKLLRFAKQTTQVIKVSFVISLLYNVVGLFFAVQGLLSPLLAAILMPLSSISVVAFTTSATNILAKRGGLQ